MARFACLAAVIGASVLLAGCVGAPGGSAPLAPDLPPAPVAEAAPAVDAPATPPVEDGENALVIGPAVPERHVIERIEVEKGARRMTLWRDGKPYRTYRVALGFSPAGHKRFEGDGRTPEGDYLIDFANPNSQYYLSLRVSYPNAEDRAFARARRVKPGGDIFIHGHGQFAGVSGRRRSGDWTEGCIAVSNAEMEEIYSLVGVGTLIRIRP